MSDGCLFCGASGAGILSNEHVIPQWLLEHLDLPRSDQLFQGVASSETGRLVQTPRVHSSHSFVQGRVCQNCNAGWLSRLENASKPILISLVEGQRPLTSLARHEAHIVSKWAAKTAYLHSWTGPLRAPVAIAHLQSLNGDNGVIVPGVGVFGMQAAYRTPSAYFLTGHWPHLAAPDSAEHETDHAAYKIGLQFRHLYLLTAFWPGDVLLVPVADLHVPVFPLAAAESPTYRIDLTTGGGPVDPLANFTNWLAVCHRP